MSRVQITTCDAPGCAAEHRSWDLPAGWLRISVAVDVGPMGTMHDSRAVVVADRALYVCGIDHVAPAFVAAFVAGYNARKDREGL